VFADSVALDPKALQDALQTQIDLGNLEQIPKDSRWLDLQWADQQADKRY
jgi:NitT/TauT family transport system substrate-binding protein